ncbi:MAG: lipopolysaccharide biosynthesis protein [Rhizobiaceae bacterium]
MGENFQPSSVIRPLVPQFVRARLGQHVDTGLDMADAIFAGKDERAQSLRTALIAFTIRIISAFIAFISQVLMARWLGVHEYGIFVWVWVAAVICGGLSCVGFPSAVVKFIPQYLVEQDDKSLRGVIFGSRLISTLVATLIAGLGIAAIYALDGNLASIYSIPLIMAAVCLPMLSLSDVQNGVARAFSWSDLAFSPTYLLRPVLILVAMIAALAWGMEPTATTALAAAIFATWFTTIMQTIIVNQRLKRTVVHGPKTVTVGVWIAVALPIFLVEGFFALLTNVDIMIAGLYLEPNEVGVYFAAVKTLALVHFVYFAVKAGSAHHYARYFTAGDADRFDAFVRDTVKWTFWPSLLMAVIILAAGKILLGLFGAEFTSGYPLMFVLAVGIIARASVGPAEAVLTMSGNQNVCAAVYGAALVINILLNLSLIPQFGLFGAAWATTITMMFEATALYAITLRRLGLHMFVFSRAPEVRLASSKAEF